MASCKECIYADMCRFYTEELAKTKGITLGEDIFEYFSTGDVCEHFKDRSRFVELPCKLGDTLYTIVTGSRIREWIVTDIAFSSYSIVEIVITADSKDKDGTDHMKFGKHYLNRTVFLSHAAAEQALKERENSV